MTQTESDAQPVGQVAHKMGTAPQMLYCIEVVKGTHAMATPIFSLSPEMQAAGLFYTTVPV